MREKSGSSASWLVTLSLICLIGCSGSASHKFSSAHFTTKILFPPGWEVWDKSSDESDFIEATRSSDMPDSKITVRSMKMAQDVSISDIFSTYLDAGDYADVPGFAVNEMGSVPCKNNEGRFMQYRFDGKLGPMIGMKAVFLNGFIITIVHAEMIQDDYQASESQYMAMLKGMEL